MLYTMTEINDMYCWNDVTGLNVWEIDSGLADELWVIIDSSIFQNVIIDERD